MHLSSSHPLELRELSKTYRSGWRRLPVPVLGGVTLTVDRGEAFGYLGPNGAGKTTTLRILLGLLRPSGGEARIWGVAAGDPASRSRLGFVPEEPSLPGRFTPAELLDYGARLCRLSPARRRRRTGELLTRLGLAESGRSQIRRLSKGQRQRTALALALVGEPDLLLLDEPLTGLDAPGRWEVIELLQELRGVGCTIFLSSHVLPDVERLCNRVAVLHGGRLVAQGEPGHLARELGAPGASLEEVFLALVRGESLARTGETVEREEPEGAGMIEHEELVRL